jgi:heterodisulfide reductase subunit C
MIQPDHFPDWGPNIQKVEGDLRILRKAIPVRTLQTVETAWEVSLKTSVEMYTIWEMTGVLKSLETMDENLFDVIEDFIDEKREDYEDWLESQNDKD